MMYMESAELGLSIEVVWLFDLYRVRVSLGNFKLGGERGTILKKLCPKEESCFQLLMDDPLRPFIPSYKGHVSADDGESELTP